MKARRALASSPASARQARRFTEATLRTWGCDELVDPVVLLTSELVTNAVLHAASTAELVLERSESAVRVELSDRSAVAPRRRPVTTDSITGRGLALVDALADRWGSTPVEDGKVVWFEVSLGRSGRPAAAG